MIRSVIYLGIAMFCLHDLCAQDQEKEISVSCGVGSFDRVIRAPGEIVSDIFFLSKEEVTHATGAIFLSYHQQTGKYTGFGFTFGIDHIWGDIMNKDDIVGKFSVHTYTFAAEFKLTYVNQENFNCFLLVGLGYTVKRQEGNITEVTPFDDNHINFHTDLFGFRLGNKLAFTGAFGFGYKGIMRAGLSYQF